MGKSRAAIGLWVSFAVACSSGSTGSANPGGSGGGSTPTGGASSASGGVSSATGGASSGSGGVSSATGGASSGSGGEATGGLSSGGTLATGGGGPGSGGAATSTGGVAGHCAPGVLSPTTTGDENNCRTPFSLTVPNSEATFIDGYELPEPTVAGRPYTLSLPIRYTGSGATAELWGADAFCDASSELLWWSEIPSQTASTYCATFTPTRAYSSLVLAMRMVADGNHSFQPGRLMACGEAGTCPSGAMGHGLGPGVTLTAPIGPYQYVFGMQESDLLEFFHGVIGRMIVDLASAPRRDVAVPVEQGVFRMDPADSLGDAWYCIGPGSTVKSVYDSDNRGGYEVSLRNVTRACEGSGAGTISVVDAANALSVASSFGLPSTPTGFQSSDCRYTRCWMRYEAPNDTFTWLFSETPTSMGHSNDPVTAPTNLIDTFLVRLEHGGPPLQVACGTQGSVTYGPDSTTTMDATGMTAWRSCPAAPTSGASLDLFFKN